MIRSVLTWTATPKPAPILRCLSPPPCRLRRTLSRSAGLSASVNSRLHLIITLGRSTDSSINVLRHTPWPAHKITYAAIAKTSCLCLKLVGSINAPLGAL